MNETPTAFDTVRLTAETTAPRCRRPPSPIRPISSRRPPPKPADAPAVLSKIACSGRPVAVCDCVCEGVTLFVLDIEAVAEPVAVTELVEPWLPLGDGVSVGVSVSVGCAEGEPEADGVGDTDGDKDVLRVPELLGDSVADTEAVAAPEAVELAEGELVCEEVREALGLALRVDVADALPDKLAVGEAVGVVEGVDV